MPATANPNTANAIGTMTWYARSLSRSDMLDTMSPMAAAKTYGGATSSSVVTRGREKVATRVGIKDVTAEAEVLVVIIRLLGERLVILSGRMRRLRGDVREDPDFVVCYGEFEAAEKTEFGGILCAAGVADAGYGEGAFGG
jgi:hypothetical protein